MKYHICVTTAAKKLRENIGIESNKAKGHNHWTRFFARPGHFEGISDI